MMYPYMTLEDGTEIVHSDLKEAPMALTCSFILSVRLQMDLIPCGLSCPPMS